jgi:Lon-like ATP-dependent protease
VLQAIEEYEKQHNRIKEQMLENITKDIRKIVVDGERVGEINALSVYHIGDYSFGLPSRITAKTFIGNDSITTIERKVGLSGRIHDKGSFILSGYFNAVFGEYMPVNFSASITFEQSYGRIDGDSASSTELYALLSSLAEVPIKQGIAVTGSVNQNGEIQAIGGVNEKVEGFFDVCRQKGLTGQQGVLIPASNIDELQLKPEVVEAVRSGQFHIWTAQNLEDGVKLLMGMNLGQRNKKGHFSKNTLFYKIEQRLRELNIRSEMYRNQIGDEANHRLGKGSKKKVGKKPMRPAAAPPKAAKNRR